VKSSITLLLPERRRMWPYQQITRDTGILAICPKFASKFAAWLSKHTGVIPQNSIRAENRSVPCYDNSKRTAGWALDGKIASLERACTRSYIKDGGKSAFRNALSMRLGRPIVAVMQATQSHLRQNSARNYRTNPAPRRSLFKSEVRAILIVIADIVGTSRFR
jgi:hypothetical protein